MAEPQPQPPSPNTDPAAALANMPPQPSAPPHPEAMNVARRIFMHAGSGEENPPHIQAAARDIAAGALEAMNFPPPTPGAIRLRGTTSQPAAAAANQPPPPTAPMRPLIGRPASAPQPTQLGTGPDQNGPDSPDPGAPDTGGTPPPSPSSPGPGTGSNPNAAPPAGGNTGPDPRTDPPGQPPKPPGGPPPAAPPDISSLTGLSPDELAEISAQVAATRPGASPDLANPNPGPAGRRPILGPAEQPPPPQGEMLLAPDFQPTPPQSGRGRRLTGRFERWINREPKAPEMDHYRDRRVRDDQQGSPP